MTSGVMGDMLLKQPGENLAFKGSTPWLTGAPCTSPVKVGLSYNLRIHAEDLDLLNLNQVFDARIAIKICKFVKFVPFSRCDAESLQVVLLIILLVSPVFCRTDGASLCAVEQDEADSVKRWESQWCFSYGFNCLPLHRVALLNWLKYYLNCLCPVVLCKQFCIFVLLYVRMWFSRSEISHNILVIGQVAWPLIIVSFGAFSDGGHWKQSFLCSLCCALMETGWPALLAPWPVWHSLQLGKKKGAWVRKPSDE